MNTLKWQLPRNLLSRSIDIMRPHGVVGNEGLALWMGTSNDERARVTHLVEVFGSGFVTSPLHLRLSRRALAQLTDLADHLGVYLIGQIHSHPGDYVDLSAVDRSGGFQIQGFLSVVCPYYAQRRDISLAQCGIHVYEGRAYRQLSTLEAQSAIALLETPVAYSKCEVHSD